MSKLLSILFYLLPSFIFSQNGNLSVNVENKLQKELKEHFSNYQSKSLVVFDGKTVSLLNDDTDVVYTLKDASNATLGFAYVGKSKSKVSYFDYVVIFDKNLIISKVKVLVYREDHGFEITHKRWLSQFIGFNSSQSLLFKKDISAISGATISATSLTNAVNNVLQCMHQLKLTKVI